MRILVLVPDHGGNLPLLLEALEAQGHELKVLTRQKGASRSAAGRERPHHLAASHLPISSSSKRIASQLLMLFAFLRMLLRSEWDLVHAFEETGWMALIAKRLYKIPYVYDTRLFERPLNTRRFALWRLFARKCEAAVIRHSSGVLTACDLMEEQLARRHPSTPVARIEDPAPPGLDRSPKAAVGSKSPIRGQQILYVADLEGWEGLPLVLDAFVHIYHRCAEAQLVVVGSDHSQLLKHQRRAESLEVSSRAHFLHCQHNITTRSYLQQANIIVSLRILEGRVPKEVHCYLASGRPLLALKASPADPIRDDTCAMLVQPTPLGLACGMEALLQYPSLRWQYVHRAQKHVQQLPSRELMSAKLGIFYADVVESVGPLQETPLAANQVS